MNIALFTQQTIEVIGNLTNDKNCVPGHRALIELLEKCAINWSNFERIEATSGKFESSLVNRTTILFGLGTVTILYLFWKNWQMKKRCFTLEIKCKNIQKNHKKRRKKENEQNQKVNTELALFKENNQKLQKSNADLIRVNKSLSKENQDLKHSNNELRDRNSALSKAYFSLSHVCNDLIDFKEKLQNEIEYLTNYGRGLFAQNSILEEIIRAKDQEILIRENYIWIQVMNTIILSSMNNLFFSKYPILKKKPSYFEKIYR